MTITEFLEARIAEDEAVAKAATPGPWTLYDRGVGWEIPELPEVHDGLTFSKADAHYVARHDPARVLAECAAKRAIMQYLAGLSFDRKRDAETAAQYRSVLWIAQGMARVYKDHPDYRQDWAE